MKLAAKLELEPFPGDAPTAAAKRSFWRSVFSFPVMLAVLLALLTFLTCRGRFNDPDLWWHLKVGESIWTTHSLPDRDLYSYTTNNHPWIPHEWLSETILYLAFKFGGYQGLLLWLSAFGSLVFMLIYALCCRQSGNAKIAFLGGLLGWFLGTSGLAIRPLILGNLFLVIELLILRQALTKDRRWLAALPPLFAIWVNCHGSFALGLAVLGIFVACSFFEFRFSGLVAARRDANERALLAGVFVLCIAALFINPVGTRLVTYPLDLLFRQHDNLANVSEWRELDFAQPRGIAVLAAGAILFLLVLIRRSVLQIEELFLLALGFALAVRHSRMTVICGILVAPVLSRLLADAWQSYDPERDHPAANGLMMVGAVALMLFWFPASSQIQRQIDDGNPVRAVEFIRSAQLSGPMLNEYVWGGYLIWALPEQKVFIDGRSDVFAWTGVLREFGRWAMLEEDPNVLLDKYGVQYCLLSKDAPMSRVLPYLTGWKKAYSDQQSVIFVRLPAGADR